MNNRSGSRFTFDANFSLTSKDNVFLNNHEELAPPFPIVAAKMLFLTGDAQLFLDGGKMEYLGE
jgi:hypothetical protein